MDSIASTAPRTAGWSGVERRRVEVDATRVGALFARYALAAFFVWAGILKFAEYEAKAIEPLIMNSPIISWALQSFGLRGLSNIIGVIEIVIGLLIASRAFWPKLSAIGSIGAIVTLLITLSFMLTTPGVWEPGVGFPFLSALPGQLLAKDLVFLGVAIWTAGESLQAARTALPSARPSRG